MAVSKHGTITGGQVVTVVVDASYSGFEVVNRDLVGEIWVRTDGVDPVPRGDDSFVVLGTRRFPGEGSARGYEIRLTAEVDRSYSVEGAS